MDLRSPRLHVPLAAAVAVVVIASATLSGILGDIASGAVLACIALAAPVSLVLGRALFLRARDAQMAYACAIVGPPALAALLGPLVVVWMRWENPLACYTFSGISIDQLGSGWPVGVALLSTGFGVLAVPPLVLQIWLARRASDTKLSALAWSIVLPVAATCLFGGRAGAVVAIVVVVFLMACTGTWKKLQATPGMGPYR